MPPDLNRLLLPITVAGAVLLVMAYLAYRRRAWKNINAWGISLPLYTVASVAFWFGIFPPGPLVESTAFFVGALVAAAVLLTPAIGLHLHTAKHRPEKINRASYPWLIFTFFLFGYIAWSEQLSPEGTRESSAVSPVIGVAAFCLGMLLLFLVGGWLYLRLHPVNRMIRLLQSGRNDEAIRFGEAIPAEKRHPAVVVNLVNVYNAAGRHADAVALAESVLPKMRDDLLLFNLAMAYHKVGRLGEALWAVETVRLAPEWPEELKANIRGVREQFRREAAEAGLTRGDTGIEYFCITSTPRGRDAMDARLNTGATEA